MTYLEYVSQFEILDNPPKKRGYDRHHIVPTCEQKKLYGSVTDQRQIYVTPAQHLWCHILYDREHGTKTAKRFLNLCGKPADYFDCWEKCLAYSYTIRKKRELGKKKMTETCRTFEHRHKVSELKKGQSLPEETKQKISESLKGKYGGEKHPMYNKHHSEETRKKISDNLPNMSGENNGFFGHHHSEEFKRKQSERKRGIVPANKGTVWWTDGINNKMCIEQPGPEWREGLTRKRKVS